MSLVVETGVGLTTAESYISVADATTYFTNYSGSDAWAAIDTAQEVALRKASRDLDLMYGVSYASATLTRTQALLFPRVSFTDTNGRTVTGLPAAVAQATAELALINASVDTTGPADTSGNVKLSLTKVDTIEQRTDYFAPTSASAAARRKITLLLAPYLVGASGLYAQVVRG